MNTDLILKNVAKHIQLDKTETDFFISLLQTKTLKRKEFLLKQDCGELETISSAFIQKPNRFTNTTKC